MDPRKETTSGPGSGSVPRQANDSDYRPDHPSKPGQNHNSYTTPGVEREEILDEIQANWNQLPTPPSAADVSRWIKAGRRSE